MIKNKKNAFIKTLTALLIALTILLGIGAGAAAEGDEVGEDPINSENPEEIVTEAQDPDAEGEKTENGGENSHFEEENGTEKEEETEDGGENPQNTGENPNESGDYEENLFEEIYCLVESNADKIFSVLAFIGTLVVGVGYKSGLLPLLREAAAKLKTAIDGVKAEGESSKEMTDAKLKEISAVVDNIQGELTKMKWQYDSFDSICRDREATRIILTNQIDMLYAIFMTSALPQYQKDEVGEKISEMREALKNYESSEEN